MVKSYTHGFDYTFFALADPTRRAILARLSQGGATASELAWPFDMSLVPVGKHLRLLETAGLVRRDRNGRNVTSHLEATPPGTGRRLPRGLSSVLGRQHRLSVTLPRDMGTGAFQVIAAPSVAREYLLEVPVEAVFDVWTDAAALMQWWCAGAHATHADRNVREGGRYKIGMSAGPAGTQQIVCSLYVKVERPHRLLMTWRAESTPHDHGQPADRRAVRSRARHPTDAAARTSAGRFAAALCPGLGARPARAVALPRPLTDPSIRLAPEGTSCHHRPLRSPASPPSACCSS